MKIQLTLVESKKSKTQISKMEYKYIKQESEKGNLLKILFQPTTGYSSGPGESAEIFLPSR